MPRISARIASHSVAGQSSKENQSSYVTACAANGKGKKVTHSSGLTSPLAMGQGQITPAASGGSQVSNQDKTHASTQVPGADISGSVVQQDDAMSIASTTLSETTNACAPNSKQGDLQEALDALEEMKLERNSFQAEVKPLYNHVNTSQRSQAARTLVPRPEGRPIRLQEDMGLANDRAKFLSIQRIIKDSLKRVGLDPMERWEHQPKNKLLRIFWMVRDRQPYMARFACDWPIKEYIKRHHRNVRAYLRRLDDGTNTTIPDIDSDEISDPQGEEASDIDMYLDI